MGLPLNTLVLHLWNNSWPMKDIMLSHLNWQIFIKEKYAPDTI